MALGQRGAFALRRFGQQAARDHDALDVGRALVDLGDAGVPEQALDLEVRRCSRRRRGSAGTRPRSSCTVFEAISLAWAASRRAGLAACRAARPRAARARREASSCVDMSASFHWMAWKLGRWACRTARAPWRTSIECVERRPGRCPPPGRRCRCGPPSSVSIAIGKPLSSSPRQVRTFGTQRCRRSATRTVRSRGCPVFFSCLPIPLKPSRVRRDDEGRDALGLGHVRVGAHVDDHEPAIAAGGDPDLGTVEHPVVAVLDRAWSSRAAASEPEAGSVRQ